MSIGKEHEEKRVFLLQQTGALGKPRSKQSLQLYIENDSARPEGKMSIAMIMQAPKAIISIIEIWNAPTRVF
jgi:hypothetical protein